MDELRIESTEDTPLVHFKTDGELLLKGRSLPEDAFSFYEPILSWLKSYSAKPASQTTIHIDLEYFNTASAKQVFKVITMLSEIGKSNKVAVRWHYDEGDKDMYASGERFSKLSSIPFEFVKN
jgi:hypothetical protein